MAFLKTKKKSPKITSKKLKKVNILIELKNKMEPETEKPKEVPMSTTNIKKPLPDNIDEYFTKIEGSKEAFHSRELFKAERVDVDIKTDLSIEEIVLINKLIFNNELLAKKGLKPVYTNFLYNYMRLKISLDRKSRQEFVAVNKSDKTDDMLKGMSDLSNITGVRK
jgi:hypothetical protein